MNFSFANLPGMGMGRLKNRPTDVDANIPDTSETVHISGIALLKMLKHCRDGVPIEVMGLLLGKFVDEYTVNVVDVFAMPQTGTSSTVDSLDPAFQADMLDMLRQTGRTEAVVGWYHSHPGFGCWLSGIDQSTQKSFEQLNPRCVAVVVDPIQSVRGKVVIDAFRLIAEDMIIKTTSVRQTTSNTGLMGKRSLETVLRGLDKDFYSLNVAFERTPLDERVLTSLDKKQWSAGVAVHSASEKQKECEKAIKHMISIAKIYQKSAEEESMDPDKRALQLVGQIDPKRHLENQSTDLMSDNISQCLDQLIGTVIF